MFTDVSEERFGSIPTLDLLIYHEDGGSTQYIGKHSQTTWRHITESSNFLCVWDIKSSRRCGPLGQCIRYTSGPQWPFVPSGFESKTSRLQVTITLLLHNLLGLWVCQQTVNTLTLTGIERRICSPPPVLTSVGQYLTSMPHGKWLASSLCSSSKVPLDQRMSVTS
jgi:hypothetical protein